MKTEIIVTIGAIGSAFISLIGGWDQAIKTLVVFISIDWITGGIILPVIFQKSPKSPNGVLESRAGWKGLARKCMILFYVLIAARLDALMNSEYLRDAVCVAFIVNESVSIIENAGLMGIPIPPVLRNAIDLMITINEKNDNNNEREDKHNENS